jgi:hypothetical protein
MSEIPIELDPVDMLAVRLGRWIRRNSYLLNAAVWGTTVGAAIWVLSGYRRGSLVDVYAQYSYTYHGYVWDVRLLGVFPLIHVLYLADKN